METTNLFDKKPYVVSQDSKGYYYIDNSCTYADLMGMVAKETTSPRGVEAKLHITEGDGLCYLCYWQPDGKRRTLETYLTKEEAEQEWLKRTYFFDFLNHELSYYTFDNKGDAIDYIAEELNISSETAASYLFWYEKLKEIFKYRVRVQRVAELKRVLQNANSKPTKRLLQCVRKFKQSEPMWHNDYNLMLPILYTQEELGLYECAKAIITCNQE